MTYNLRPQKKNNNSYKNKEKYLIEKYINLALPGLKIKLHYNPQN